MVMKFFQNTNIILLIFTRSSRKERRNMKMQNNIKNEVRKAIKVALPIINDRNIKEVLYI